MSFETLEQFYEYVRYLEQIEPTEENILKLRNFMKLSPNKFARKLRIDDMSFQKEYNEIKGKIHRKYIYDKEYVKLVSHNPKSGYTTHWAHSGVGRSHHGSYYNNLQPKTVVTIPCICIKDYMKMGEPKFYKNIKYLYYHFDDFGIKNHFVLTSKDIKKDFTKQEFDEHFLDLREYKLKQLLD